MRGQHHDDTQQRVEDLREELDGLRRALRTRATIEQAMGVLIVSHRCAPQQAFKILVGLSQQHNVKLYRLAQLLVRLAAHVPPDRLELLLLRAVRTPSLADNDGDEPIDPASDSELVDHARVLVDAADTVAAPAALTALHELLVSRGWIPPYEALARFTSPDS
ncbi:MAG: hypothetical protein QOI21_1955 [Actinomycetota bacterium]|jgi:hypothetical protein|nr:hypothetical protein [Actinomycetota bacterium]